jgi:hypothetical protein
LLAAGTLASKQSPFSWRQCLPLGRCCRLVEEGDDSPPLAAPPYLRHWRRWSKPSAEAHTGSPGIPQGRLTRPVELSSFVYRPRSDELARAILRPQQGQSNPLIAVCRPAANRRRCLGRTSPKSRTPTWPVPAAQPCHTSNPTRTVCATGCKASTGAGESSPSCQADADQPAPGSTSPRLPGRPDHPHHRPHARNSEVDCICSSSHYPTVLRSRQAP